MKNKLEPWVNAALDNLKEYCEKLASENKKHSSELVLPAE
jgi:hypothetical protein